MQPSLHQPPGSVSYWAGWWPGLRPRRASRPLIWPICCGWLELCLKRRRPRSGIRTDNQRKSVRNSIHPIQAVTTPPSALPPLHRQSLRLAIKITALSFRRHHLPALVSGQRTCCPSGCCPGNGSWMPPLRACRCACRPHDCFRRSGCCWMRCARSWGVSPLPIGSSWMRKRRWSGVRSNGYLCRCTEAA